MALTPASEPSLILCGGNTAKRQPSANSEPTVIYHGRRYMAQRIQVTLWVLLVLGALFHASRVFAAYPLITDDTGTQGRGGFQMEFNGMLGYDTEGQTRESAYELITTVAYGLGDNTDLVFGVPYQRSNVREEPGTFKSHGISDVSLELKWKFYQIDGLSLAFKPVLTFPTGNHKKGIGTGKVTYTSLFILTQETPPWSLHANVGYGWNNNRMSERKDVWHVSIAAELEIFHRLKLVGNIGTERNRDKTAPVHPAFVIGGFIYSISKNLDIACGIQFGVTKTETDYTIRPGIVYRFNFQ